MFDLEKAVRLLQRRFPVSFRVVSLLHKTIHSSDPAPPQTRTTWRYSCLLSPGRVPSHARDCPRPGPSLFSIRKVQKKRASVCGSGVRRRPNRRSTATRRAGNETRSSKLIQFGAGSQAKQRAARSVRVGLGRGLGGNAGLPVAGPADAAPRRPSIRPGNQNGHGRGRGVPGLAVLRPARHLGAAGVDVRAAVGRRVRRGDFIDGADCPNSASVQP